MKNGPCPKDIKLEYPDCCDDDFWKMMTKKQEKYIDYALHAFTCNDLTKDHLLEVIRKTEKIGDDYLDENDRRVIALVFNFIAIDFERQVKEKHPIRMRNSPEYQEWRACVFERDHYTCQNCGQVGWNLNAHHIKPFKDFPNLRLDVNNGITLCRNCHLLAHGKKAKQCRTD